MSIAVVYLVWKPAGVDPVDRFLGSYLAHPAGIEHDLILHEFNEGQDIPAYFKVAEMISHDYVCCLNTHTEIVADHWLAYMNARAGVAFGGFLSKEGCPNGKPSYPNLHFRSNGFLINRKLFLEYPLRPVTKRECYEFESGPCSLTKWLVAKGCFCEFDGIPWFRKGNQEGLLFADNQSRHYQNAGTEERKRLTELAWGPQL